AHLEPEILVVDEVLAVGDAAFQKKCLGKMGEVASEGRTVLFVSHQMNAIRKLCNRCVWLDDGQIKMVDSTTNVLGAYESALSNVNENLRTNGNRERTQFLGWEIAESKAESQNILSKLGPVTFKFLLQVDRPILDGSHGI